MTKTYMLKLGQLGLIVFFLIGLSQNAQAQSRPKYRTLDGTLNNLSYPDFGRAGIPFFRELPAEYADGKNALVTNRPNPRLLSNKLSDEPEDDHNDRYMAGMFYSFGQFFDHDITRGQGGSEAAPISLPSGEKIFTSPISFTRSAATSGTGITTPRDQSNTTTAWVDASQVYGDNQATANWIRTFQGGKLKVSSGNLLPFNTISGEYDSPIDPNAPTMDDSRDRTGQLQKVFIAGDPRASEHPVLTSLHTLFMREHNRLCQGMQSSGLSDEEIYQKARKEVGAIMQNIVFGQWISSLGVSLNGYTGYKAAARPDIMNTFATAAYRWHTMVENDIIFRDNSCQGVGPVELPLKDIFFNPSIVRKYGIDVLLKGISVHRSYETDLKVNNGLRNFLFGPGSGLDLVSINIQRGRDHGLPNYNTVRQFYTGIPAYSFTDIAGSSRTSVGSPLFGSSSSIGNLISSEMQSLYGDVNKVDLWVGLYAEPRLSGKSVGKTVDAILRAQMERLRDGDFYYFENDPELTAADKSRIRSTTLKHIIERNTNAGDLQDDVFFVKSCSSDPSEFDDIAKRSCNETPQYDGWTFIGWTDSGKKYYKWNGGDVNFEEARSLVSRLGGHLPRIANASENTALTTSLKGGTAWLDLGRVGTGWQQSGSVNAADQLIVGATPPYYNWSPGEPNNFNSAENVSQILSTGKWNDVPQTWLQPVVAEVPCNSDAPVIGQNISVNNGSWLKTNTVTVVSGQTVKLDFDGAFPTTWKFTYTRPDGATFAGGTNGVDNDQIQFQVATSGINLINKGTWKVNYTNPNGQSNIGYFIVNCMDGDVTPPLFTYCPPSVSVDIGLLSLCKPAYWNLPTATDNGGFASVIQTSGYTSGWCFLPGTYNVTYTATDLKGNKSNCSFTITARKTLSLFSQSSENLAMEAHAEPTRAAIEWVSNTGFKNDYFTIEKANNATGLFEKLQIVNNKSKDNSQTHYVSYDNALTEGDNTYRVSVTFQDGSTKVSDPKTVKFTGVLDFKVFPNPANDVVSLDLSNYKDQPVEVYLYNSLGQPKFVNKLDKVGSPIVEINVSDQPVGHYLIRVTSKGRRDVTKTVNITH